MFPATRVKYETFKEEIQEQLCHLTGCEGSEIPLTMCNGKTGNLIYHLGLPERQGFGRLHVLLQ